MSALSSERSFTPEDSGPTRDHDELVVQVLGLWHRVVARRAPDVAAALGANGDGPLPSGKAAIEFLQALNMRFQLLRIVDENAAIRGRRRAESQGGVAAVPHSFAALVAAIRTIAQSDRLADRFPRFRAQFDNVRSDFDRIHMLQIDLLREARRAAPAARLSIPLFQSMNCISSALGWTG